MILWLWFLLLRFLLLDTDSGGSDDDDGDGDSGSSGGGNGDGDSDSDDDETRNPEARIKSLLEANARLHKRLKQRDKRIKELEAQGNQEGQLQGARLAGAFWRHVATSPELKLVDPETAYDLATSKGFMDVVKFSDDGSVSGMDSALEKLSERYPWLISDDDETEGPPIATRPSGRQPLKDPKTASVASAKLMQDRFPALRRRVGKR